jgi:hypothetical protein
MGKEHHLFQTTNMHICGLYLRLHMAGSGHGIFNINPSTCMEDEEHHAKPQTE